MIQPLRRHRDDVPLERWFAGRGAPPRLDLARSGAASMSVAALLDIGGDPAHAALLNLSLDYGPGQGQEGLRLALAQAGIVRDPEEVLITHGATEALLLAIGALCSPGERVAVAVPAYGGLVGVPASLGCELEPVRVWREGSPHLDLGGLHRALDRGVRVLILNSPHNPTGAVARPGDVDQLARRCLAHRATLVLDEVSLASLDAGARSGVWSAGFAAGSLAVVSDLSKGLGLGGLRVGWLSSADTRLMARARGRKDATTIANAGPAQVLAQVAVAQSQRIRAGIRSAALANRDRVAAMLSWRLIRPVDGLVALVRIDGDDKAVADRLLRRHRVAVVPGSLLDMPGHLRLGLGLASAEFSEGLAHIAADPSLSAAEPVGRAG